MLRNQTDKILSFFLVELEKLDEKSMEDAITQAFTNAFSGDAEAPSLAPASASANAHAFTGRRPYVDAEKDFLRWCELRLHNFYALKFGVVAAALSVEPRKENAKKMAAAALGVLRAELKGKQAHSLYADAQFLQALAVGGSQLNYELVWREYEREHEIVFGRAQRRIVEAVANKVFTLLLGDGASK